MKKIWEILFFAFFIFCMFLFKPRQDLVFAAIDESQYIRLFEEGSDFVICVDENKVFTGTYTISMDTVLLVYRQPAIHNRLPPRKLYINKSAAKIRSTEGNTFSAEIYMDIRDKTVSDQSAGRWDLVNRLAAKREKLSLSEAGTGSRPN